MAMQKFEAKVVTRGNRVQTLSLQAADEKEARKSFNRTGRVVAIKKKSGLGLSAALTPGERQIFFTRLSAMLSSRVGTSEALQLLRDTFGGTISRVSGQLLSSVQGGLDLPEAFERIGSPNFPQTTVALIRAGSRSGETWRAIKDAAEFEYELHTIKKGAAKGLWSGIAGFLFAGALGAVSTLYAGPKIMNSPLIKASNKDGSVNIDWINDVALYTGAIMAVMMVIGVTLMLLASVGRLVMPTGADKLILKVPFYKDLVLAKNNFIVLYGLALLIRSGVRVEEALRLTAEGAPKGALKSDLVAATTAVRTGRPWPAVMKTMHPTDKAALSCATDREQIAATLSTLANQYRTLYAQRLASFVPALQMVAALFLSISGGLIFGQTVLPMLMASKAML